MNNFVEALEGKLANELPENFTDFSSLFNQELDNACKLDKPRHSKRNAKNNPWITSGLISSINRKHELYDDLKKARNKKCLNKPVPVLAEPLECVCPNCKNEVICEKKFKAHRKLLTHLINCAKHKYSAGKIAECAGDSRKTWQIIKSETVKGKVFVTAFY